jgi:ribonucleotide reductase alpha subunit
VKDGELDSELLAETVHVVIRLVDNVIDINFYPTEEAKRSNLRRRPIGLGLMGFQDALFEKGLAFESPEALELADTTQQLISYHAILASSKLAAERGAYGSFEGSKWDLPLDVTGDRPGQGEELLRDAGDGVPARRVARVGLRRPTFVGQIPPTPLSQRGA